MNSVAPRAPEPPATSTRLRRMLKSKIHRIAVTGADLHYPGSLTLGPELVEAADLLAYEEVDVVNVNNGARFSTYVIVGGPGECCLNGAAARLGETGDLLIVMAFDLVGEALCADWRPRIVHVDEANRLTGVDDHVDAAGPPSGPPPGPPSRPPSGG